MKINNLGLSLLVGLSLVATSRNLMADSDVESYSSNVGLVTVEGPTGMFLNPTSGTPDAGTLKVQVCGTTLPRGDQNIGGYQLMASYALTDWFELGAQWFDASPNGDTHFDVVGPQARMRIHQESDILPEVSVGGFLKEGDSQVAQRTTYVAASKFLDLDQDGLLKRIGLHAGFKYVWLDSDFNEANGAIGYTGAELALPKNLFLVGEVSLKDDLYDNTPYSYGLQLRDPSGFGFSLAGVQTGFESRPGIYIGVGINLLD